MSFKSLGLSDPLLKAIAKKGYTNPSPIQEKAIPVVLERKDILASAQTGTGKTAGFTLPMLEILTSHSKWKRRPIRALVLTPTRELAAQIYDNVRAYSEYVDIRSAVIFGGVKAKPQIATLRSGVDILIATPGRLIDLHSQKALSLARIEILVLDEADRMLDMGFKRDLDKIMSLMPDKRQNLLFSATFSKEIKALASGILQEPVLVEATPENSTAEMVVQKAYRVDKAKKTALVTQLISDGKWKQVLIFTRTKHGANRLTQKLVKKGITAAAIHGNKSQNARTKALKEFKSNKVRVLVATDIAARGLDIPLLPHVINYELPNVPEDYVHRIGRTGRAGASGEALSLVSAEERDYLRGIEKLLGQKMKTEILEGYEVTESLERSKPTPKQQQQRRKNSSKPSNKSNNYKRRPKRNNRKNGDSRNNNPSSK
ncbi:DEAD/DEAH box helicase [Pseudofulvibacter geojedonensis]|uniref:DEAD/DEAH box helicase n=1 Tax=Pseudofulvibacter geojedonensis TaxID=1123758 RepID=A0ABW3I561_9FLAO